MLLRLMNKGSFLFEIILGYHNYDKGAIATSHIFRSWVTTEDGSERVLGGSNAYSFYLYLSIFQAHWVRLLPRATMYTNLWDWYKLLSVHVLRINIRLVEYSVQQQWHQRSVDETNLSSSTNITIKRLIQPKNIHSFLKIN